MNDASMRVEVNQNSKKKGNQKRQQWGRCRIYTIKERRADKVAG